MLLVYYVAAYVDEGTVVKVHAYIIATSLGHRFQVLMSFVSRMAYIEWTSTVISVGHHAIFYSKINSSSNHITANSSLPDRFHFHLTVDKAHF